MSEKSVTQAHFSSIGPLNKGLGYLNCALHCEEIVQKSWNLLREDLMLPTAVLLQEKLTHNLDWMREFIAAYGLRLAPHGKTSMAPKLFEMQCAAGAWGITLATVQQAMVAQAHGIRRVLMANQLIGKQNMAAVAGLLEDHEFDFYCLVDSAAQAEQLGAYFSESGQRLQVLLELGVMGGRAGVRNGKQLSAVVDKLARWKNSVILCGIEVYEGVLDDEASIRGFLREAVEIARQLAREDRIQRKPMLLSGAGSAWYDVVAEEFSAAAFGAEVEIVLRPGCYLTHDVGSYRHAQERILERNPIARKMRPGLLPALQVWAYVQSIPEAEMAIVAMGKRDAAFDSGLPVPSMHFRPGQTAPQPTASHWKLTKMMDHHAYMSITAQDDIRVGDMLGFDICHPCLTFDKWRTLPLLDSRYQVVDIVPTFF